MTSESKRLARMVSSAWGEYHSTAYAAIVSMTRAGQLVQKPGTRASVATRTASCNRPRTRQLQREPPPRLRLSGIKRVLDYQRRTNSGPPALHPVRLRAYFGRVSVRQTAVPRDEAQTYLAT